jgi:hypothetical protein
MLEDMTNWPEGEPMPDGVINELSESSSPAVTPLPTLTEGQAQALNEIIEAMECGARSHVLTGYAATGKRSGSRRLTRAPRKRLRSTPATKSAALNTAG